MATGARLETSRAIRTRWSRPANRPLVAGAAALTLVATALTIMSGRSGGLTMLPFGGASLLGGSCYVLAGLLLNSTTLRRHGNELWIWHGPLPLLPPRLLWLDPHAEFRVVEERFTGGPATLAGRSGSAHAVHLVNGGNGETRLIGGLNQRQAARVVDALRRAATTATVMT